jgi:hypothetical protein
MREPKSIRSEGEKKNRFGIFFSSKKIRQLLFIGVSLVLSYANFGENILIFLTIPKAFLTGVVDSKITTTNYNTSAIE